jgi:hypothetical protein
MPINDEDAQRMLSYCKEVKKSPLQNEGSKTSSENEDAVRRGKKHFGKLLAVRRAESPLRDKKVKKSYRENHTNGDNVYNPPSFNEPG